MFNWEPMQEIGMRESGEVRPWRRKAIKGSVFEVAALDYESAPLRHLERYGEPPELQRMGSWNMNLVPDWLRVFSGVLTSLDICALQARGRSLEAERQREVGCVLVKVPWCASLCHSCG